MAITNVTKRSTMQEILEAFPSAERVLYRQFHIGGCQSCGYKPTDILEDVAHRNNISDAEEILRFVERAKDIERHIQISPEEVAESLSSDHPPSLVDVRSTPEWELAHIPGAYLLTDRLAEEMLDLPKDAFIVFYCHTGHVSVDAASYLVDHGYENARSMTGGIDAWSLRVDPSVPRYTFGSDAVQGKLTIRPAESIVSYVGSRAG